MAQRKQVSGFIYTPEDTVDAALSSLRSIQDQSTIEHLKRQAKIYLSHNMPLHRLCDHGGGGKASGQECVQYKGPPQIMHLKDELLIIPNPGLRLKLHNFLVTSFNLTFDTSPFSNPSIVYLSPKALFQDLVQQAPADTAVWAVDTACVVPVTLSKRGYAKAYAFRSGFGNQRKERLQHLPYPSELRIGSYFIRHVSSVNLLPLCTMNR